MRNMDVDQDEGIQTHPTNTLCNLTNGNIHNFRVQSSSRFETLSKSLVSSSIETLVASPVEALVSSPIKSLVSSPIKSLVSSPIKSLVSPSIEALVASPVEALSTPVLIGVEAIISAMGRTESSIVMMIVVMVMIVRVGVLIEPLVLYPWSTGVQMDPMVISIGDSKRGLFIVAAGSLLPTIDKVA